jgi:hypothetical protein
MGSPKRNPPVKATGTMTGAIDAKRFRMPGVEITSKCPQCGRPWRKDLARGYLSDPVVNEPFNAYGHCLECDHEWPVMVVLRVTLEPAAP